MTDEQSRKIMERGPRYLRLGFTYDEIVDKLLPLDDELWERSKDLPINPDNWVDEGNRALEEGASEEELREIVRKGLNQKHP